jgi:L-fuconolactonase
MKPTRRDALIGGLAALTLPATLRAAPAMLPAIDTHEHLWDLTKIVPPWIKPGEPGDPLARSFTPADYAAAIAGLNVVKSVYMEVAVAPADVQKETDTVVGLCESGKTTMAAAVVGGFPGTPGFAAYITPYKGHKFVKGVRKTLHGDDTPAGHVFAPAFVRDIQRLGELGLSFDLCARPAELADMAKLVGECPGTRFVLDHCGNASVKFTDAEKQRWRRGMDALAARKNVVCKVSGFIVNGGPKPDNAPYTAAELAPVVDATIAAFGIDRVMFGGDWPVVTRVATYRQWLTTLREIIAPRPEADQRKVLHDNAAKFYGL